MTVTSVLTLIPSDIIGVLIILLSYDFFINFIIIFYFFGSLQCLYCSQFDGDYCDLLFIMIFFLFIYVV